MKIRKSHGEAEVSDNSSAAIRKTISRKCLIQFVLVFSFAIASTVYFLFGIHFLESTSSYDAVAGGGNVTETRTISTMVAAISETKIRPAGAAKKTGRQAKPKLFMHIGPKKTGTTSIQIGILGNKEFRQRLGSDNYQVFSSIGYDIRKQLGSCLLLDPPDYDDCYEKLSVPFEKVYNETVQTRGGSSSNNKAAIRTIHSLESWSAVLKSESAFIFLKKLFDKWDVHFVIFYRPFFDWLPSLYAQYRKPFMYMPKKARAPFINGYKNVVSKPEQKLFPEYLAEWRNTSGFSKNRDILTLYVMYKEFLVYSGYQYPDSNIHTMQLSSPHGIKHEFLCKLLHANASCNYSKLQTKNRKENSSAGLPLNLDLIIVEAWKKNLISIPRHDAVKVFEERMIELNITMTDFPHVCISEEAKEWVWNRTVVSERMFGTVNSSGELDIRRRFDRLSSSKGKLCSVNAKAALDVLESHGFFDNCEFQSEFYIDPNLQSTEKRNPKWTELGCTDINKR